ncbi:MAG: DUF1611 domain-containing protein, partial [Lachnospiraceae bacterium]|nr:DUF1611 domain-containing protein [Lachnospiraceae bacterium]
ENGIDENTLISALSYIYESIHPDIINLSLGVSECNHIQELYDVCSKLTSEGTIIVSAFDNAGSISYPAAFNNVIGVVNRNSCHKVDDFEYFEDQVVNVGAKGSLQRLAWDNPQSVFLSGNSFACAHTTAKIAEMMFFSRKKLTKEQLLNNFKKISIKNNDSLNVFSMQKLPFNINVAALFPFGKEMQNLVRYERLLNFKIADIYETKYSAKIGATTNHLLNANYTNDYVIKNIDKINYNNFDTLIIGHMDELSSVLGDNKYIDNLIADALKHHKNIFSFDDVSYLDLTECQNLYTPLITINDLPPNRLGMLHRITKPVLGVFGTSSKQGKFTLQLKLRELLLKDGFSVGQLGTEPTSQLYGMEFAFPMGYNSTVYINNDDAVRYINSAIHNMNLNNKDIIIVGSQSGTIAYDYGNISQFPTSQYALLLGSLPDCIILCVNLFDSFEYIHRTISFLESSVNSKVIALATIPFAVKNNGNNSIDILKTLRPSKEFCKVQELFISEFHIPLYNITDDGDMEKLYKLIISFFS